MRRTLYGNRPRGREARSGAAVSVCLSVLLRHTTTGYSEDDAHQRTPRHNVHATRSWLRTGDRLRERGTPGTGRLTKRQAPRFLEAARPLAAELLLLCLGGGKRHLEGPCLAPSGRRTKFLAGSVNYFLPPRREVSARGAVAQASGSRQKQGNRRNVRRRRRDRKPHQRDAICRTKTPRWQRKLPQIYATQGGPIQAGRVGKLARIGLLRYMSHLDGGVALDREVAL